MGKTTNLLEELTQACFHRHSEEARKIRNAFFDYHENIRCELELGNSARWNEFKALFDKELLSVPLSSYDYHYDQIVSKGELASTLIVSEFLNQQNFPHKLVDVRELILTDAAYREANVFWEKSVMNTQTICIPLLQQFGLILTQGFIGATPENTTTTLGREGSDYTAALLSNFLNADRMIVWKDVPGILNADPRYFKNPVLIPQLSYYDAIEMTYYGATVLHPKTIHPLQKKKIPLFVKSFLQPDAPGTLISGDFSEASRKMKTFIYKPSQILISVLSKDFNFIGESSLGVFFSIAQKHKVRIHLMQNSAMNFSVCTDNIPEKTGGFIENLREHFRVTFNEGVGLLTIRGKEKNEDYRELLEGKNILLIQKTRNTSQYILLEE